MLTVIQDINLVGKSFWSLSKTMHFVQRWPDEHLHWDRSVYEMSVVSIPLSEVWHPDIVANEQSVS